MYQNDLSQENDNKESGTGPSRIVVTLQDFGTNQSCASAAAATAPLAPAAPARLSLSAAPEPDGYDTEISSVGPGWG
jgi:hypothetical protein